MKRSVIESRSPTPKWRRAALLVSVLLLIAMGAGIWLASSTTGLRWVGSTMSYLSKGQVSIEGLDGTLLGPITARTVRVSANDMAAVVQNVRLHWQPGSLMSGLLEITFMGMEAVEVISPPSSEPQSFPQTLELPIRVRLHKLDIGVLRVLHEKDGKPDFAANQLKASLSSEGGRHQVRDLRGQLEFGVLTASGEIEELRPFGLSARAELEGLAVADSPQAQQSRISAIVSGNLERLEIRATGEGGGLTGEAEAQLRPYDLLKVARLRMAVNGLDPNVFSPNAPKARLDLQADLRENAEGQLGGRLVGKNGASKPLDHGGLPLLGIEADTLISTELLQLDDLLLVLPNGGKATGNVSWRHQEGSASGDLRIIGLDPAGLDTRLRVARINGTMKLSGDAKSQQGILALTDKNLKLDVAFERAGEILSLNKLYLRHGRTAAVMGRGKLGLTAARPFHFEGSLQHFDVSAFVQAPRTNLNATLKAKGELESASAGGPAVEVDFRMGNSQIGEHDVTGDGSIEFSGRDLATIHGKGEVKLRLGLNQLLAWGAMGHKGDQLQLSLTAPKLAQIGFGLRGSLAAEAVVETGASDFRRFSQELPDMSFSAEGKSLSFRGDHKLGAFSANGSLRGNEIALTASLKDYGTAQKTVIQSLDLEMSGFSREHELVSTARLGENQNLTLRIRGGLHEPAQKWQGWRDARWAGKLAELTGNGQFTFRLTDDAPLELAANHLSLGAASIAVGGGNINISRAAWTPQAWNSNGNFSQIRLRPRNSKGEGEGEGEGQQMLRLGGEWDISSGAQLRGRVRVARESGDWVLPGDPPFSLGLQALEMSAHASDGKLTGELIAQGKHLGRASASVTVPLAGDNSAFKWTVPPGAPLSGIISVNMEDISWAGAAFGNNNNLRTGGQLVLNADLVGTFDRPRLSGRIRGDDLAVALLDQGVWLERGTLAARFDEESLHMDALDFSAPHQPMPKDPLLKNVKLGKGPGTLRAGGVMDLTGKRGNLEITASLLPLAQRPDRWIIASGNGHATLENNMLTLRGTLAADAGLLAQPSTGRPHLPDDVVIIGQNTDEARQPDRDGLRIDVEAGLDLGSRFYIRASGLQGRLDGELRLRGEPGRPLRATGTIAARDTKFEAYGQNLVVERGIVNFRGAIDDPALNVLALRKGLSVEAGVEVTGTVRQPKVRLVSTPNVPDLEKLSWIALGRAAGGKADASLLLAAAGSIMGGQAGGVMEKISRTLGVDELSIRQAGIDPLMGQVGVIGKRISDRAYITYEQGLMAVAGVTKLTYNLTPKITVVTRAGLDNAIDVLYTLRFD